MHIADHILREVEENRIVDIFSEPDKTKIFLQLQELEMIKVSEDEVKITEKGREALEMGIRNYFAQRRSEVPQYISDLVSSPQNELITEVPISVAIPAVIFLVLLLFYLFGSQSVG